MPTRTDHDAVRILIERRIHIAHPMDKDVAHGHVVDPFRKIPPPTESPTTSLLRMALWSNVRSGL